MKRESIKTSSSKDNKSEKMKKYRVAPIIRSSSQLSSASLVQFTTK